MQNSVIDVGRPGPDRAAGRAAASADLLWTILDPFVDPGRVAAAADADFDRELLVSRATAHRLGPLLWRALGKAGARHRLGDQLDGLRVDAAGWAARAHFIPTALARAIDPLTAAGLEPVVYKGPALAMRYPDPATRTMLDLDLLVSHKEFDPATHALVRAGWHLVEERDRYNYEASFVHPEAPRFALELHQAFDTWHIRSTALDSAATWRRRRPIDCMGTKAYGFDPVDELITVAAHAAKPQHWFGVGMWASDILVLLREGRAAGMDWELVARRAGEFQCRGILAVAVAHAALAGVEAPAELLAGMPRQEWRRAALAPILSKQWLMASPTFRDRRRAMYALPDRWRQRAGLMLGETPFAPAYKQPLLLAARLAVSVRGFIRLVTRRQKVAIL